MRIWSFLKKFWKIKALLLAAHLFVWGLALNRVEQGHATTLNGTGVQEHLQHSDYPIQHLQQYSLLIGVQEG